MDQNNTTRSTRTLPNNVELSRTLPNTDQTQPVSITAEPQQATSPTKSTRALPVDATPPHLMPYVQPQRDKMIPSVRAIVGRPPAFDDPNVLIDRIDDYFASCFTEKMVVHPTTDGSDPIIEYVTYQFAPFTLSGLALYLGITTKTLREYAKEDRFGAIVLPARHAIEQYCEKYLFEGKNSSVVWNLMQANYGYRMPKTEVALEATGKDGAPLLDPERNNSKARQTRAAMLAALAPTAFARNASADPENNTTNEQAPLQTPSTGPHEAE